MGSLLLRRPGLLTLVQDLGRPGLGRFGVSPSGAMDSLAARAANALLGNLEGAPLLELTGAGAELVFQEPRAFALTGADLDAWLEPGGAPPRPAARWASQLATARTALTFRSRRSGARAYLAVSGGIAVAPALGSASTDLGGAFGGCGGGRPLRAGQILALGPPCAPLTEAPPMDVQRWYDDPSCLRFIPSCASLIEASLIAGFAATSYRLSSRSNRMGYRLEGAPLPAASDPEAISRPLPPGTIQLPPDGLPILLMADRQTVGGYPALGYLIQADTPKAAQLWPGDSIRFVTVTQAEAHTLARLQEQTLTGSC
jgi:antagonist of KipI